MSEGVFQACLYLGLKFPPEAVNKSQPVPSDYFGDDFELDSTTIKKLCSERKWTDEKFAKAYKTFAEKFLSQRSLKHTKTDLNVYFCDHVLFAGKQLGSSSSDYFDFELYNKSFESRRGFLTQKHRNLIRIICNDPLDKMLLDNKPKTNELFAEFLHRDWLDTRNCAFEDFKRFVEKHQRFFSKPFGGSFGIGAQILNIDSSDDLEEMFLNLKSKKRLLEEIVTQHKELAAFCSDTVNTVRVNTFLDIHNVVHILTTGGRFGRMGNVVDNFHGGGFSVTIDAKTGIITSDGINRAHERMPKHPDSGKIFKGFQYPCWQNMCETVKKMAKIIPQMRHVGWDIAINDRNETVLIEANVNPDVDVQQAPDNTGKLYLYVPFIKELQNCKKEKMYLVGYRVNNLRNFEAAYEDNPMRLNTRLKFAMRKLIPDCKSLMDVGCRKKKLAKSVCPEGVKYYPVDFKKHDDEVIACDFNNGEFPDIKVDVCLCALTAEFVEPLPQFLGNMCEAANKQILMWCRPVDKETSPVYRWNHPFLTDFTEEFLIKTMEQNDFKLKAKYPSAINPSVILYDFKKLI